MMCVYSAIASRSGPGTSLSLSCRARLSAYAAIVAKGLLISCITPAESWPNAASRCASATRSWARFHSVMSSPMVITCVTAASLMRIGIFDTRYVLRSPAAFDGISNCDSARAEHLVELLPQHVGGLPPEDLEDRPA